MIVIKNRRPIDNCLLSEDRRVLIVACGQLVMELGKRYWIMMTKPAGGNVKWLINITMPVTYGEETALNKSENIPERNCIAEVQWEFVFPLTPTVLENPLGRKLTPTQLKTRQRTSFSQKDNDNLYFFSKQQLSNCINNVYGIEWEWFWRKWWLRNPCTDSTNTFDADACPSDMVKSVNLLMSLWCKTPIRWILIPWALLSFTLYLRWERLYADWAISSTKIDKYAWGCRWRVLFSVCTPSDQQQLRWDELPSQPL